MTSTNGGHTWGNPNIERADQGTTPIFEVTHFFNDKESITADPLHAGTAYVVWDRLQAPSFTPDAALRAHAFRGPAWFSKTTDGGKTWSTARPIFDPGQNNITIGNNRILYTVGRQAGGSDYGIAVYRAGSAKIQGVRIATSRGDAIRIHQGAPVDRRPPAR